ncbi:tripartite tricarboxylate transporter TctB family protein [Nesterenkonia alba]|uniref:tripartite tricarboxylate transporter TctB family protein n=1 Tax=Nesterenkonia alba TaxID=515814 RepID=UPI000405B34B|nr:tripartite tricarboxylate transporter TctB family protein [Nesterenkonia alba]
MSEPAQMTHPPVVSQRSWLRLALLISVPASVGVYAVAFHFSVADLGLDSRAYPQGIIAVLLVLLLSQAITEMVRWWKTPDTTTFSTLWRPWHRTALAALCTAVFLWGIGTIGFYESLALYGLVLLPVLGVRRPLTVIAFNVGLIAGVYLLFDLVLNVRLPGGLVVG